MLLIKTQEHVSAFNAADRVVGHDRDRLPKIHIEKILIICSVLGVTPYELLGATEGTGRRSSPSNVLVVEKDSEYGAARRL